MTKSRYTGETREENDQQVAVFHVEKLADIEEVCYTTEDLRAYKIKNAEAERALTDLDNRNNKSK